MKMEHALAAPVTGVVRDVAVAVGHQVRLDEVLAVIDPELTEV